MKSALDKFLTEHDRLCGLNEAYSQTGCTCGRDEAIDELDALRTELKTRELGSEQALNDICEILNAPEWEYPGQVVRDVLMLVERSKAVVAAYADYCFDDRVIDLQQVDGTIDHLASYLRGELKVKK